jgi:hypothetical protein
MKRSHSFGHLGVLLLFVDVHAGLASHVEADTEKRPNVVLILADDKH